MAHEYICGPQIPAETPVSHVVPPAQMGDHQFLLLHERDHLHPGHCRSHHLHDAVEFARPNRKQHRSGWLILADRILSPKSVTKLHIQKENNLFKRKQWNPITCSLYKTDVFIHFHP